MRRLATNRSSSCVFSALALMVVGSVAPRSYAGFNWGNECGGEGAFQQPVAFRATLDVGDIPAGKADVFVELTGPMDVDIQLVDTETGAALVAWPSGVLSGPSEACASWGGVNYCYSGYDGDQTDAGKGHEWIRIDGTTNRSLTLRVFGYEAGDAEVHYRYEASTDTCNEMGAGAFDQWVAQGDTTLVGTIPVGKVNVTIELQADDGRDVDVQLYDGETPLVQWPDGALAGPTEASLQHQGMTISYSGYNGLDGDWGHERVEIQGAVTRPLTMGAFGYQAGTAHVTYSWGDGVGDLCGGIANFQCADGLECKGYTPNITDPTGTCHTHTWCGSGVTASADCAEVVHVMIPGVWGCTDHTCDWKNNAVKPPVCLDPAGDPWQHFVSHDTQQCAVTKFTCEPFQTYFADACGCGCRCPETWSCMPGPGAAPCDVPAIEAACPNTQLAW